jgi:hypothetical protein
VRDELSKPEASKRTFKVAAILVVAIVLVIAGASLWSSNYRQPARPSATSDKIELVDCSQYGYACGALMQNTAAVTVRNVGSGVVEITAIYIGADLHTYSASASPGKFSATSNQIAPGQTVTFIVTKASGWWYPKATRLTAKAVTKNGAEASKTCGCF